MWVSRDVTREKRTRELALENSMFSASEREKTPHLRFQLL
jgi:hypothetical protein